MPSIRNGNVWAIVKKQKAEIFASHHEKISYYILVAPKEVASGN